MGASKEFPITDHDYVPCGCGDPDCPYCGECREQECFHQVESLPQSIRDSREIEAHNARCEKFLVADRKRKGTA
jgi:hypothetical protein